MANNTRAIAAGVLCRVVEDGQSLTAALDRALAHVSGEKDRAFVQLLCYGTLRWYWRLDFLLNQMLRKPLKHTEVRLLALLGLFQIANTRVKPHAAVAETVSALRGKAWAKPLLNAVLRNYLRARDTLDRLADHSEPGATGHPHWLVEAIRRDWHGRSDSIFHANNEQPPMALRINLGRCGREEYLERLSAEGIRGTISAVCDSAVVLESPTDVKRLPGFEEGWVSVQDCAAQLAASVLDLRAGQTVLDVCAAPGGKTAHILEACPDVGRMVAVDIDAARLERVRENLARGRLSAELVAGDGANPAAWWDGCLFDRILLDAPCSATGVIRRHPDIKLLRQPEDIESLSRTQQRMLRAVWPLLAPGGSLVYATCSILKRENEDQVEAFLATHADAFELPIDASWGVAAVHGRQILTGDSGMDGFYYARIGKKGG